jgi:hypothetical protein
MRYAISSWTRRLRARRCIVAQEFALVRRADHDSGCRGGSEVRRLTWTWLQGVLAVGANIALVNAARAQSADGDALGLATDIANLVSSGNGTPAANVTVTVNDWPAVTVTNGRPPPAARRATR